MHAHQIEALVDRVERDLRTAVHGDHALQEGPLHEDLQRHDGELEVVSIDGTYVNTARYEKRGVVRQNRVVELQVAGADGLRQLLVLAVNRNGINEPSKSGSGGEDLDWEDVRRAYSRGSGRTESF